LKYVNHLPADLYYLQGHRERKKRGKKKKGESRQSLPGSVPSTRPAFTGQGDGRKKKKKKNPNCVTGSCVAKKGKRKKYDPKGFFPILAKEPGIGWRHKEEKGGGKKGEKRRGKANRGRPVLPMAPSGSGRGCLAKDNKKGRKKKKKKKKKRASGKPRNQQKKKVPNQAFQSDGWGRRGGERRHNLGQHPNWSPPLAQEKGGEGKGGKLSSLSDYGGPPPRLRGGGRGKTQPTSNREKGEGEER